MGSKYRLPTRPLRRDPLSSGARTFLSGVQVSLEVGSTLGSFKVTALIGEGGGRAFTESAQTNVSPD